MEVIKAKGRKNVGSPQEVWVVKTEAVFQSVLEAQTSSSSMTLYLLNLEQTPQLRATSPFGKLKMLYSTCELESAKNT